MRRKTLDRVVVFWRAQQFCLLILILTVGLAPLAAEAQPTGKVWRIGFISSLASATGNFSAEGFTRGLRELGYVEGSAARAW